MKIKYKNKEYVIPKPFDQCFFGKDPTHELTIHNRFSDETFKGLVNYLHSLLLFMIQ